MYWSCTIKLFFLCFYVLIRYSVWNASLFSAAVEQPNTEGVSWKKNAALMIFASAVPRGRSDGQQPPATGSAALHWCHEKTAAALHTLIKLYQQLASCPPQPCLLSSSLSVPLYFNLPPSLSIFHSNTHTHTQTQCPSTESFCVILLHDGTTERASASLLPLCWQIFTVLP